jgi:hypothetical protein
VPANTRLPAPRPAQELFCDTLKPHMEEHLDEEERLGLPLMRCAGSGPSLHQHLDGGQ